MIVWFFQCNATDSEVQNDQRLDLQGVQAEEQEGLLLLIILEAERSNWNMLLKVWCECNKATPHDIRDDDEDSQKQQFGLGLG